MTDVRVPFAGTAAVHGRTQQQAERAVADVLASGQWVGGPIVAAAEQALAAQLGRRHGVGTASGTSALTLALQAAGVGPGDEVVVPAVSFVATATAVMRAGARPVLVDVLPGMPLVDPAAVAEAMSPRVRAVVSVPLFGCAAPDVATVVPGVTCIDDAAQAFGRTLPVGTGAIVTCSFYPTKVLPAAGDGGLVATNDPAFAARVRALGFHGLDAQGRAHSVGTSVAGNDRLDAIQAALLLARLPDVAARVAHRRSLLAHYRRRLPTLVLPHDEGTNGAVVAAVHPRRDEMRAALARAGIQTACYYPLSLADHPVLANARVVGALPRARAYCSASFALPCHIGVSLEDVDTIADILQGVGP